MDSIYKLIDDLRIEIISRKIPLNNLKGLCIDDVIVIDTSVQSHLEKRCIVAEELGHYHKTYGNILDQKVVANQKQELLARTWAYENLVSFDHLINAFNAHISGYELAEYLNVSEEFLYEAIQRYHSKYGPYIKYGDYIIYFDPLGIMKFL